MYKKLILAISVIISVSHTNAQVSVDTAKQQLSLQAKQKVANAKININSLLGNSSNDLIVEFESSSSEYSSFKEMRENISSEKKKIKNQLGLSNGLQLLRDYNALPLSLYRVNDRSALVKLLNDPKIKAVYPNSVSKKTLAESLPFIGQPVAKTKGLNGEGTSVAVLDSGVDYTHKDFGNCTSPNSSSSCRVNYAIDFAPQDNMLDDDERHGTNVAAIVAGTAPKTKIIAMDVFRGESAYDSDIAAALNWVANNAGTLNIKAANMSLGGGAYTTTCRSALTQTFQKIRNSGVIPIVAAGNSGNTNRISHPACVQGAVSVGAVYDANIGRVSYRSCTDRNSYADKVACFSNSASFLSILAPGTEINAGGVVMSGTSQATPHVAGAVAVLRANNALPNESLDSIVNRLRDTGTWITDQRNGLRFPRLNLEAAVSGINTNNPTPVTPSVPQPINPTNPNPINPSKNCYRYLWFTICEA